jgi:hypothetical protein
MSIHIDEIKRLLSMCTPAEREEIFRYLREEIAIHPLEQILHSKAEVILEALHKAGGVTLRMIPGVIAELAFGVEVVQRLAGWETLPRGSGETAYDFHLRDRSGPVRVQVKLQRSKQNSPLTIAGGPKRFRTLPADMFVVETQKTRAGTKKGTGISTRPYRYGEFDLLAVSLYPSTKKWDVFMYTVADWLVPDEKDGTLIFKYQPVASSPNEDWTSDFEAAVAWLRSGVKKTIRHT